MLLFFESNSCCFCKYDFSWAEGEEEDPPPEAPLVLEGFEEGFVDVLGDFILL